MHGSFFQCDRCDLKCSYVSSGSWYYQWETTKLLICVKPAWCLDCDRLRSAEDLPTIEHCGDEVRRFEAQRLASGRAAAPLALDMATARLAWRIARTSPPRCISCGTTNIRLLALDDEQNVLPFDHPGCGGTMHFSSAFLGSGIPTLFSPEGMRVETES